MVLYEGHVFLYEGHVLLYEGYVFLYVRIPRKSLKG